jgi:PIN domain nuclease of toxin-antitoxin system
MAAIAKAQTEDGVALAAISLWELAMLLARGRIQAYGTIDASIRLLTEGVVIKPITAEIAAVSAQLPQDYPQDPAARLIGATARVEGMPLITRNEKLRASSLLQTIW